MFGKKNKKNRETERMLKQGDLKKPEVNRKLIGGVFAVTAAIGLVMWWANRGEMGAGRPVWEKWFGPVKVSYSVGQDSPTPEIQRVKENLVTDLREMTATASGTWAVYVYEPDKGEAFGFNEREVMPGASILKVPAMIAALRRVDSGQWLITGEFELKEADRSPGSGPLQYMAAGTKLSLERILTELGKKSDNTAWLMVNRLAGIKEIEDVMLELGMSDSDYRELTTTAVDIAKMWAKYGSRILSNESWARMRQYLTDSIYEDRIPAGIADGEVTIVHKVGTLAGVWADAGIVECERSSESGDCEPFVVVILNKEVKRDEAQKLVPGLVKRIWEYEKDRVK